MSQASGENEGNVANGKKVVELVDNPFQSDGELRRKADYIVRHSRISRTEVQIADPDAVNEAGAGDGNVLTTVDGDAVDSTVHTSVSELTTQSVMTSESVTTTTSNTTTISTTTEKQEKTETTQHPTMEVRVTAAVVETAPEPSSAETVKIKSKKCIVM